MTVDGFQDEPLEHLELLRLGERAIVDDIENETAEELLTLGERAVLREYAKLVKRT